jgi:hypothetical protein
LASLWISPPFPPFGGPACQCSAATLGARRWNPRSCHYGGGAAAVKISNKAFFNKRRLILPQAYHLRLPPPTRGKSGKSDGGSPSSNGPGENLMATGYICSSSLLRPQSSAAVASKGGAIWKSSYIRRS